MTAFSTAAGVRMQVWMSDAVAGPETGVGVAEARLAADHVGEQMMPAPANVEFGLSTVVMSWPPLVRDAVHPQGD